MNEVNTHYAAREHRTFEAIKSGMEDIKLGRVVSHPVAMKRFAATIDRVERTRSA